MISEGLETIRRIAIPIGSSRLSRVIEGYRGLSGLLKIE